MVNKLLYMLVAVATRRKRDRQNNYLHMHVRYVIIRSDKSDLTGPSW